MDDENEIVWTDITNTRRVPRWPGNLNLRRDPGDLASSDWGTRSPTKLDLDRSHSAVLTCSHHRLTIWVVNEEPPLPKRDLARLLRYVASVGRACDCYRGPWLELFGENFCRAAAIRTWRWLEDTIGHTNVWAWWWRRNPPGREWQVYSAYVDDGLLFPRSKYDKPRYPRGPRAHPPANHVPRPVCVIAVAIGEMRRAPGDGGRRAIPYTVTEANTRSATTATEGTPMKELNNTELRQERAIIALLAEPSIEAAAKTAEVSDVTIWRWMKQPEFKSRLRDARRAMVEGAIGRLQQAVTEAVETLRRNLTCGTPSVEVRAAATMLDQAIKAVELFDMVERVEQLEARLGDGSREAQP